MQLYDITRITSVSIKAVRPSPSKGPLSAPAFPMHEDRLEVSSGATLTSVPQDVVPLAVFLASSGSDCITGQVYNVEGGMVMS